MRQYIFEELNRKEPKSVKAGEVSVNATVQELTASGHGYALKCCSDNGTERFYDAVSYFEGKTGLMKPTINIFSKNNLSKMRFPIMAILAFVTLQTMAQGLTGKIVDENQQPVSFANIAVLSDHDSTLTGGTVSDDNGAFKLEKIEKGVSSKHRM